LNVHVAPHRHIVASNSPNPVPNPPGIGTKFGTDPLQKVSTTIATLIAFPVNVTELGTILQVMLATGLVQVNCTVPVVPGKAVSTNPKMALLPGVVVTVEVLPCPIPIVTGLLPLLKVAVTAVAAVNVTTHVPVPVQPPPFHPANVEPSAGLAVNVTCVPLAKPAEHVDPQLIPAGLLVTVPDPVPALVKVSVKPLPELKVAVTVKSAVPIGTVQLGGFVCGLAGTQFELNPAKVDPSAAVAVNVTLLLSENGAKHTDGQLMPVGVLVTVPVPVPISVAIRLFVPTSFSPNIASPEASPEGVVNDSNWVPLAMSNSYTVPVARSAVQNEVPPGSRLSANREVTAGFGV
jgi:hypothetical protein